MPRRCRLAELPARGPHVEHGASNADQSYNEAAFDPDAQEILRRLSISRPEPAIQDSTVYPVVDDADDDFDDDAALYDDSDHDDLYGAAPALPNGYRSRWVA